MRPFEELDSTRVREADVCPDERDLLKLVCKILKCGKPGPGRIGRQDSVIRSEATMQGRYSRSSRCVVSVHDKQDGEAIWCTGRGRGGIGHGCIKVSLPSPKHGGYSFLAATRCPTLPTSQRTPTNQSQSDIQEGGPAVNLLFFSVELERWAAVRAATAPSPESAQPPPGRIVSMRILGSNPVLAVHDLDISARWFTRVLGCERTDPDPGNWAFCRAG